MKDKEKICLLCYNMDWRVPVIFDRRTKIPIAGKDICICGRKYRAEIITQETCEVMLIRSSAGRVDDFSSAGIKDYYKQVGKNKK